MDTRQTPSAGPGQAPPHFWNDEVKCLDDMHCLKETPKPLRGCQHPIRNN